ncbi:MAG: J domain-containing protein [Myxococcales bacterium]|nr:J domain-containing protein [Myxococcales bacterium]
MGFGVFCCSDAQSLRRVLDPSSASAAVVRVRALALPSMFPSALREALNALPYRVACVVAPPEALPLEDRAVRLGDSVVFIAGRVAGRVPAEASDPVGAVFGLLSSGLSPRLGRSDQPRWEDDEGGDPFSVLGVSPAASLEQVRAAWRAKLAEYHPDKFMRAGSRIQAVAADESRRLNAAFARIAAQRGTRPLPKV